jgi:hypothetical protein
VLDAVTSRQRKADGQQRALEFEGDEWIVRASEEFAKWLGEQKARGFKTITVEEFRAQAKNQPLSHKAWGALPRLLCKAGLIAPAFGADGERLYRRAAAPKTHAHPVAVWRVL